MVYTFGREHEKECAYYRIDHPEERLRVARLIDVIHDLLERTTTVEPVVQALGESLIDGRAGTWEDAGGWVRKLSAEYPEVLQVWRRVASHASARVRFRAAAHLSELPERLAEELGTQLLHDASWKVREKAASDLGAVPTTKVLDLLTEAAQTEGDPRVLDSIRYGLELHSTSGRGSAQAGA